MSTPEPHHGAGHSLSTDDSASKINGSDWLEIHNVLGAFARLADEGTIAEIGSVLSNDIEWSMPGVTWRGLDAVLAGLTSMRAQGHAGPESGNKHIVGNFEVSVTHHQATARSYFQLLSKSHFNVVAGGSYEDRLDRTTDGKWLLARRTVHPW